MVTTTQNQETLALLLPSKGRFFDLLLTILLTPLPQNTPVRPYFVVCANYSSLQLKLMRLLFSSRASFIDERELEFKGMVGAYNYAFAEAKKINAKWVALWADDLLPSRNDWLSVISPIIQREDFHMGVLSSDEGNHKGRYGFNVFANYPCAHFFIAKTTSMPDYFLNPKFRSYTGDNEIAINFVKRGLPVQFLPLRVIHQPTANSTRKANAQSYKTDLDILYQIHPELTGKLDAVVLTGNVRDQHCAFVPDQETSILFSQDMNALPYDQFLNACPVTKSSAYIDFIWNLRRIWNQGIVLNLHRIYNFDVSRIKTFLSRRFHRVFQR